ncbi:hypothetical protein BpHYR1_040569 [Brachionus plicatilis]|uniref:Uncharacterized protein n=1 Tax=Brachionus plicatilis TaxID=10195 RepID=A0A3M7RGL4_BRAPC|nr:hypothetical protein BpHYR1_040569 [Brachionus plicatilis]
MPEQDGDKEICKMIDSKSLVKFTANEALSIFISCNLTQASYQFIRNIARQKNADIFPTYDEVLCAKNECFDKEINVDELKAEVNVQDLLNITARRLIQIESFSNKLTMLNGKAANEVCENSASKVCNICGAKSVNQLI